jgi:hypothetical protein
MNYLKISIKLGLIIMIFIGLERMPYSYYEMLRISLFLGSISLIIIDIISKNFYFIIFYFVTLVLFNPIDKIYFKRDIWHMIDTAVIGVLIITIIFDLIKIFKRK